MTTEKKQLLPIVGPQVVGEPKPVTVADVKAGSGKSASVSDVTNKIFTHTQFDQFLREHRRAIIYGAVLTGFVQNKPGATPSPANMKIVRELAEAALELMG